MREHATHTNTELLENIIKRSGLTITYLARMCGLSRVGFYNCMRNRAEFKGSQIGILCYLLRIDDLELKERIFFATDGAL